MCGAKASLLWLFCFSGGLGLHVVVVSDDDAVEIGPLDVDVQRLSGWKGRTERGRGLLCPLLSTAAAAPLIVHLEPSVPHQRLTISHHGLVGAVPDHAVHQGGVADVHNQNSRRRIQA